MTSVDNYWLLVDRKDKFDATAFKGKFTSPGTINSFLSDLRISQVKPGNYNNRNTVITRTTGALRITGE